MARGGILCHGWPMRSVHALALPVALMLALGLSACGSSGQIPISEPTKSAGETTASTDPTSRPTERPTTRRPTERPTTSRPTGRPTESTPTATPSGGRAVHSTDLQVGDCYNETDDSDTGDTNSDGIPQIGDVEVVDCSAPHGHEVYSNHQIAQSTFPDRDTMSSEATTACVTAFETYVGVPLDQSRYSVSYLTPSEGSWAQGDHTITCTIVNKDGSLITGSLKGAAR